MTQRDRIRVSSNGVLVVVASYKVGECYGIKCTVQSELVAGTILNTVCECMLWPALQPSLNTKSEKCIKL